MPQNKSYAKIAIWSGFFMNLYDTIQIHCARCEKSIGEIEYDAKVINPLCGTCADPKPEGDKILYTISHYASQRTKQAQPLLIKV